MSDNKNTTRNPWAWIPSLYFTQGIPYVVVMLVSVIMYKRMGISNAEIAFYTSLLYLPWVIKPLWSPFIDLFKTKRFWIILMQLLVALGLAGVAFAIPLSSFLQITLAFFLILAFSSATHDIAADGFYMLALTEHQQAFYVGIRSTFYRVAMIIGQGLLIIIAGYFEVNSGLPTATINVFASPVTINEQLIIDESFIKSDQDTVLKVITQSDSILVSTKKRSKAEVDSIIYVVQTKNIQNGFYVDKNKKSDFTKT